MISSVRRSFDIDVDVKPSTDRSEFGIRAVVYNEATGRVLPHPSGVYIEDVPVDALTGSAAFDYITGDDLGYFKVDILSNSAYNSFGSKQEVLDALDGEVDWSLLEKRKVVESLPHLAKHFESLQKIKPRSVEELADFLALIRPGKAHLFDEYIEDKERVRRKLYLRPSEGIYFKKSHAISYALMITCVLNKVHNNGIVW